MTEAFDPYRKWLGIPPAEQPPHHYRLLGIGLFEDDPDVIESAADQRMSHLRTFQSGQHSALSQRLLNEVAAAKLCLLSAQPRAAYDAELRQRLAAAETSAEPERAETAAFPAPFPAPIALPTTAAAPTIVRVGPAAKARATASRAGRRSSPAIIWGACGGAAALLALIAYLFSGTSEPRVAANLPPANGKRSAAPANAERPQAAREQAKAAARMPAISNAAADASAPTAPDARPAPANVAAVSSNAATSNLAPPMAVAPFDAEQARAHQEAWAAYLKTPVEQKNSVGMPLLLIPPGEFTMGSTPEQIEAATALAAGTANELDDWTRGRLQQEAPAHRITISRPFLLGATEVTIGQYRRFIKATSYVTETERFGGGSSKSTEEQDASRKTLDWQNISVPADDETAVGQLTWNDAVAFCNWLSESENLDRCYLGDEQAGWTLSPSGSGYRLPTEAEWEYACRAGTTTSYFFGDDKAQFAEFGWSDRTGPLPFPVAARTKRPNAFGLFGMHGNADEWCNDWFAANYYAESPAENPTGPLSGDAKIRRGGGWTAPFVRCRSAFRGSYPPFWRFGDLGFRVVRVSTGAAADSEGLANNSAARQMDATDLSAPPLAMAPFDAKQARAHQDSWAKYLRMPVELHNSSSMPLVLIPPGEFTMGSTPEQIEAAKRLAEQGAGGEDKWSAGRISAEAPAHRVKISRPFLMGATEVTVGQFRRFVDESGYITETERLGGGSSTSKEEQDPAKKSLTWSAPSYPVNDDSAASQITWNDAVAFCNWLSDAEQLNRCYLGDEQVGWTLSPSGNGYRLPTEAEWEYACRAGTTTQYSFGDDAPRFGEYGWNAKAAQVLHPVAAGAKSPNPFGLFDMHGNVDEWCGDWFSPNYYAESPPNDPEGPVSGSDRIRRGGGWSGQLVHMRSAFRGSYPPFWRFGELGFRVVRVSTGAEVNTESLAKSEEKSSPAAMPEQPAAKPRSLSELLDREKPKTAEQTADAVSAKEAFTLTEHTGAVTRVAFHPFLPLLASAGKDGPVLLWDLEKKTLAGQFEKFKEKVWTIKFSPDGNLLAYANRYHWGSQVPFKAVATAKEVKRLKDFKFGGGAVGSIAFSPDGAFFAAGQDDGTIRLWETAAFQELPPLSVGSDVNALVFGPISFDRKRKPSKYLLAAGCKDGSIKTLELAQVKDKNGSRWTFSTTSVEFPQQAGVLSLRFSPDGKLLASGRFGGLISLFDPETGKRVGDMTASNANIDWVCFHPSEPWLIAAHWQDHRARIWNTKSQQMIYEFPKQDSGMFCAEFSRDGRRVATASKDFSISIWDLSGPGLPAAPKRAKKAKPPSAIVGD